MAEAQVESVVDDNKIEIVNNIDRFSDLPPEVVHHILSPLPISDLIRVGSLSKRCRQLCSSTPTLNFSAFPSEFTAVFNKRLALIRSLDRFFRRRSENDKVQGFNLTWDCEYLCGRETDIPKCWQVEASRVFAWVFNAVYYHVEHLSVSFRTVARIPSIEGDLWGYHLNWGPVLEFPSWVFTCESLRSINVQTRSALIKARDLSFSSISKLVRLRLKYVTVEDDGHGGFCKWISLACRFLKELTIDRVVGFQRITIESSSLESIKVLSPGGLGLRHLRISGEKIEHIDIAWYHRDIRRAWVQELQTSNSLAISAPNLKHLSWSGDIMKHHNLGELNCLEKVDISLESSFSDQFLPSILSVKVLNVDQRSFRVLFKEGYTPPPLHNVQCLHVLVTRCYDVNLVPRMASLFKMLPNLITMDIVFKHEHLVERHVFGDKFDREYWESQHLDFISKLEDVTIEITCGYNGLELARYMLEHAQNLKKMVLICSLQLSSCIKDELRRTSVSNASIVFTEGEPVVDTFKPGFHDIWW